VPKALKIMVSDYDILVKILGQWN